MKRNSISSQHSLNKSIKKAEFNSNDPNIDYWGITHIKVAKFSYRWTIQNYNFCCLENQKFLQSLPFSTEAYNRLQWQLIWYPKGDEESDKGFASLYLKLEATSNNHVPVRAQYEFSILNKIGVEINMKKSMKSFKVGKNLWGFSNYIKQDIFDNETNDILVDGCLTIICKMCISLNDTTVLNEANAIQSKLSQRTLSNDFASLFENNEFSDVKLNVSESTFSAHKVILAARSPVFLAMFKNDMKEKSENTVVIPDVNPAVMKEILRYIYTEKVENLYTMAKDIIPVADKYALEGLRTMCEKALAESFTVSNVTEILLLADVYNATFLKKEAMLFINLHSKDLIDKPEFKALEASHPHLTIEIFRMMIKKQKL